MAVDTGAKAKESFQEKTIASTEIFNDDNSNGSSQTYSTGWRLCAVTVSLALGMFLVGVDSSVIGVAIPRITETYQSLDDIAWYGSAYMLPCTILQPSFGWLYRIFNVTYIYLSSVILFEGLSIVFLHCFFH